ncbi:hypothetical protein WJX81_006788 [Elliptochloris bilobata]|uniref:F-box protein n=1 Tax=Elliptochloris bilobata TaxID=381761 RepID=A0AAW1SDP4_9CHLO
MMLSAPAGCHELGYLLLTLSATKPLVPSAEPLLLKRRCDGVVLCRSDGAELRDGTPGGAHCPLLGAVARLVAKARFAAHGAVVSTGGQGTVNVRLDVCAPAELVSASPRAHGPAPWAKDAALVFAHLHACDAAVPEPFVAGGQVPPAAPGGPSPFSLASCFAEASSGLPEPAVPPIPKPSVCFARCMAELPAEVLEGVVAHLSACDAARLGATCRGFRALAAEATPGLRLSLYPHQRAAVRWMLAREAAAPPAPHPCWRRLRTRDGLQVHLNAATGEVAREAPALVPGVRGGFLCDEPGLGKTVTGLALMLKSHGRLPAAPRGPAKSDGSEGERSAGGGGGEEARTWVACDLCNKWRVLPAGNPVPEGDKWFCAMHPEPAQRSCTAPRAAPIQQRFAQCDGFFRCDLSLPAGPAPALGPRDPAAVAHFRRALARHPAMAARHSAARLLARQPPEALLRGITLPRNSGLHAADAAFLKEVGLEPEAQPGGKRERAGAGARMRRWRQPWHLDELRLDVAALRKALAAGAEEEEQQMFLSPATLLVVPGTLIPHWRAQIEMHTRPGALRLAIVSEAAEALPAAELAWRHDVVLTTFSHLSAVWSARGGAGLGRRHGSPLMQVHWLRIILDEGHMLGASLTLTNKLQMAVALRAERRWVMTGTPTPSGGGERVAHLQPLLAFLYHQPYGEKKAWEVAVQKPFEARRPEGRDRLVALLRTVMIRAAKADLITLPRLEYKVTRLDFLPEHAESYNELVEVVERNLLLADWRDEHHEESMLHVKNTLWGAQMLQNLRWSCNVSGAIVMRLNEEDMKETLEKLVELHPHLPAVEAQSPPWLPVDHPLVGVEGALRHGGACERCAAWSRLLLVTPCIHMLCVDCAGLDRERCALEACGRAYRMQAVDHAERALFNKRPQWAVPEEFIFMQPAGAQEGALGKSGGEWSHNWRGTRSSKCAHLLRRLAAIGAWQRPGSTAPARKAIVYTHINLHRQLVEHTLEDKGVRLAVLRGGMNRREQQEAVDVFQHDDEVGVLLMDSTGALGLDLSFVGWVFLMEPLEDASQLLQVISRAHRMGASDTVRVEVLAMKGTAEEELVGATAAAEAGDPSPALWAALEWGPVWLLR